MKQKLFGYFRTNRKGLALISVLGVVTLATILILALFSVSDSEFKAAKYYADGAVARQLADNAVNLVISQIQAGATGEGVVNGGRGGSIWASQPGGVRVYKNNGEFAVGRRLYSASEMVVNASNERDFSRSQPDSEWDKKPGQWVDLNEPVIKAPTTGVAANIFFPIIDPRAAQAQGDTEAIEGFSYDSKYDYKIPQSKSLNGVVSTGSPEALRLPMPVEWLYVLKDGSMGTVQSTSSTEYTWSGTSGSGTPSRENPIVGRVGFWTDDESCKVNINTAGEPGFFAYPTVFHARDWNWANNQPTIFEYQRYPGHPATVALSSVLYPNPTHSALKYDADSYPNYPSAFIDLKNKLCQLAPKLAPGGSADGTLAYTPDDFSANASPDIQQLFSAINEARNEHPFVSVDELIFSNKQTSTTSRDMVNISATGVGRLVTPEVLERTRFFLTAQSRAPEINMFGYPRVAIWPVPDDSLGANFRTVYDSTIAYAAQLGTTPSNVTPTNAYYFRRRDANSALVDIGRDSQFLNGGLQRNGQLMAYLDTMISTASVKMPGGGNFYDKYGIDSRQILVEIFDYIRTTNLYDSFLDEKYVKERGNRDLWDDGDNGQLRFVDPKAKPINTVVDQAKLWRERPAEFNYYTYTAPRFDTVRRVADLVRKPPTEYNSQFKDERVTTGMYPGHGQVRPIEWSYKGQTYRGLGRFPTISEISLHFICTGDGKNNDGSYKITKDDGREILSGGKATKVIDPGKINDRRPIVQNNRELFWYSNIPPFPDRRLFEKWGCSFGDNTNARDHVTKHPGWDSKYWNATLDYTRGPDGKFIGIPLGEDEKRIQMALEFEMFLPSVGYTKYAPDFTVVLDGHQLGNLQVKQVLKTGGEGYKPIFADADRVVQSTYSYWGSALGEGSGASNVSPTGGSYGTQPLMTGRSAAPTGLVLADSNYNDKASSDPHGQMLNFPLVSDFFTVKRDRDIEFKMANDQPLRIDIYASHDWKGKKSKKRVRCGPSAIRRLPSGSTPVPKLVVYSSEHRHTIDGNGNLYDRVAVQAPRWWAFNAGGAVNRFEGKGQLRGGAVIDWGNVDDHKFNDRDLETRGRFQNLGTASSVLSKDKNNKWTKGGYDNVPMNTMIYGYSPLSDFKGVQSRPSDAANEDSFQIDQGGMGNYGYYGSDSVRSLVPRHGDYRVLAGRAQVPAKVWEKHRVWTERPLDLFAHSLTGVNPEVGFDTGTPASKPPEDVTTLYATNRMVANSWYPGSQIPDTPQTAAASSISTLTGDFDNGVGNIKDGPYINKADDGNLSAGQMWYGNAKRFAKTRNAYFIDSFLQTPSSGSFFTPNRMLSSPVMFGSLPTGVYGSRGRDQYERENGVPWRTLLFRPDPSGQHVGSSLLAPADHYYLDLFWMPVVEPYAISDSFSTAGKINLNYQMLGFPHITRATALHAAMKGELISGFSNRDVRDSSKTPSVNNPVIYKSSKADGNPDANTAVEMWDNTTKMEWHRHINIPATLRQLEDKFYFTGGNPKQGSFNGLLRTASQLCEMHLVPMPASDNSRRTNEGNLEALNDRSATNTIESRMIRFWQYNNLTGDNTRERPYANLYQKLTTRSNTFRVHFIAQTIKKAKSVDPTKVDAVKDTVTAEYRGSALLERFLDFTTFETNKAEPFPDYADGRRSPFDQDSLERFYHYRILEMKQFSP